MKQRFDIDSVATTFSLSRTDGCERLVEHCREVARGRAYTWDDALHHDFDMSAEFQECESDLEYAGRTLQYLSFTSRDAVLGQLGMGDHPVFKVDGSCSAHSDFPVRGDHLPFSDDTLEALEDVQDAMLVGCPPFLVNLAWRDLLSGDEAGVDRALEIFHMLHRILVCREYGWFADDDWDDYTWYILVKNSMKPEYCILYYYLVRNGWFHGNKVEMLEYVERYFEMTCFYRLCSCDYDVSPEELLRRYEESRSQEDLRELALYHYERTGGAERYRWSERLFELFPGDIYADALHFHYLKDQGLPTEEHLDRCLLTGDSLYMLGCFCQLRPDVPDHLSNAAGYYRRAIEFGSTDAMLDLGMMHLLGDGVEKDIAKAEGLFLAAIREDRGAAAYLANLYHDCGQPGSKALALYYYVQCSLDFRDWGWVSHPENLERSFELVREDAESGDVIAQVMLSLWADNLVGDFGTSDEWLEMALQQDDPLANLIVAWRSMHDGDVRGPELPVHLEKALKREFVDALVIKGVLQQIGDGSLEEFCERCRHEDEDSSCDPEE
ncbi:MAG: hypothetical protein MJZ38_00375 [archaeon]|nr:hypothetical protein [archaeon]